MHGSTCEIEQSGGDCNFMEETKTMEDSALSIDCSIDRELIESRERRVAEARSLNLLSNTFMSVALDDIPACQYVLRILLGIPDLLVKEVRVQYRISKVTSHDAILDVLAEDSTGKLYNIEIQRASTIDHARRTRFYAAMIDSAYLAKGTEYDELPDVHILYISETDLWNEGKTCYPVEKYFRDTAIPYDDGLHVLYVNAAVDDGSDVAKLMEYFKTTDPNDMAHGELSKRVHFLKCEEGGVEIMCEMSDKWLKEGIELGCRQGEVKKAKETALTLADMGLSVEQIAHAVKVSANLVKQWLDGRVALAKQ